MVYEESTNDPLYLPNTQLNSEITLTEVKKVLAKCKANKAVGIDCIPYEILKTNNVTILLQKLFNKCFHSNMVPSVWLQAVFSLFPKVKKMF